MLDVVLARLGRVVMGVGGVAARRMSVVRGLLMVAGLVLFSCMLVMFGRHLVMMSGLLVRFRRFLRHYSSPRLNTGSPEYGMFAFALDKTALPRMRLMGILSNNSAKTPTSPCR